MPETQGDFAAIQLSGKVSKLDIEIIAPLLETKIQEYHMIALYVEMDDFHGWTGGGFWADTRFDLKHHGDFSRVAMVGDRKWEQWMTALTKPFTSAAVRYYDLKEREVALRWASGGRIE